jgi:carbamoyl-phosphate synthase small subunit
LSDALLVLEDGRAFGGQAYGAAGRCVGEAVFSTAMTGYQETLTDPSYHRQIVVQTAPHIGNTGINDEDGESGRIWVGGYVVRDPSPRPSSWRSRRGLAEELVAQGVVGISGVDTRALTRHLRERGAMRAGIFTGREAAAPGFRTSGGTWSLNRRSAPGSARGAKSGDFGGSGAGPLADLVEVVRAAPRMAGASLAEEVSTGQPYVVEPLGDKHFTVVAVDLGIKASTPRRMAERGMRVHVLPAGASLDDVLALAPDGVFFSNGPGDPATADGQVELLRAVLGRRIPFFGICFGNQLLGRALGFGTYKLDYGHRGINQPVLDRATGRVEVTAHNHGFAVDAPRDGAAATPFGRARVSHLCLNDDVVEGLECLDAPAFSVQYHPEAAAGPHDADHLFDRFADLMRGASDA